MDCPHFLNLIAGYLDDELSCSETTRLSKHLGDCSACQAELKEQTRLHHIINELPAARPPTDWKERLLYLIGRRGMQTIAPLNCADCLNLLEPLTDGELSRPEAGVVIAHASTCRTCTVAWKKLESYWEIMREAPRPISPAGLKTTVLTKVRGTEPEATPWLPTWVNRRTVHIAMAIGSVTLLILASFRLGQKMPIAERLSPRANPTGISFAPSKTIVHANLSGLESRKEILIETPSLVRSHSSLTQPFLEPTAFRAAQSNVQGQLQTGQHISAAPSPRIPNSHRSVEKNVPILTLSELGIIPITDQTGIESPNDNPSRVGISRFALDSTASLSLPELNVAQQTTHTEPVETITARPSAERSNTHHRMVPTVQAIEVPSIGIAQRNLDEWETMVNPIPRQATKEHSGNWWTVENGGESANTYNLSPIANMVSESPSQRFHHPSYYLSHGNFREFFQDNSWENYHARTYNFSIFHVGMPF